MGGGGDSGRRGAARGDRYNIHLQASKGRGSATGGQIDGGPAGGLPDRSGAMVSRDRTKRRSAGGSSGLGMIRAALKKRGGRGIHHKRRSGAASATSGTKDIPRGRETVSKERARPGTFHRIYLHLFLPT